MALAFYLRIVAWLIAIPSLVGLCTEGTMAQPVPQLRLAALERGKMMTEFAVTPTRQNLFKFENANSRASCERWGGLQAVKRTRARPIVMCRTNPLVYLTATQRASAIDLATRDDSAHPCLGSVSLDCFDGLANFVATYLSLRKSLAARELPHIQERVEVTGATVIGVASTYNPYNPDDNSSGGKETASGEPYDPAAWTAAIQIDLREQFGGVRYGTYYQPTYALVESGEKKIIVKINDVGLLKAGHVIDLNERSMHYFDPSMELGFIHNVKVTPLPGFDWTPGPVDSEQSINFAVVALQSK